VEDPDATLPYDPKHWAFTVSRTDIGRDVTLVSQRVGDNAHIVTIGRGVHSRPYLRYGDRGRLQNVSPPSVLFESSRTFYNTQETDAKNDGPEF